MLLYLKKYVNNDINNVTNNEVPLSSAMFEGFSRLEGQYC